MTQPSREELLACPFCGGTVEDGRDNIRCDGCGHHFAMSVAAWNTRSGEMSKVAAPPASSGEVRDDDPDVVSVANAIAVQGFGRPWDDFLPVNAQDTDQGDLIEYAKAAVEALRNSVQQPNRGALLELLSNAYNEGFGEGMREHTSQKGGWPWNSRKQKYGALLDKICAVSSTAASSGEVREALEDIIATDQREKFTTIECNSAGNTMRVDIVDGPCAAIARAALKYPSVTIKDQSNDK